MADNVNLFLSKFASLLSNYYAKRYKLRKLLTDTINTDDITFTVHDPDINTSQQITVSPSVVFKNQLANLTAIDPTPQAIPTNLKHITEVPDNLHPDLTQQPIENSISIRWLFPYISDSAPTIFDLNKGETGDLWLVTSDGSIYVKSDNSWISNTGRAYQSPNGTTLDFASNSIIISDIYSEILYNLPSNVYKYPLDSDLTDILNGAVLDTNLTDLQFGYGRFGNAIYLPDKQYYLRHDLTKYPFDLSRGAISLWFKANQLGSQTVESYSADVVISLGNSQTGQTYVDLYFSAINDSLETVIAVVLNNDKNLMYSADNSYWWRLLAQDSFVNVVLQWDVENGLEVYLNTQKVITISSDDTDAMSVIQQIPQNVDVIQFSGRAVPVESYTTKVNGYIDQIQLFNDWVSPKSLYPETETAVYEVDTTVDFLRTGCELAFFNVLDDQQFRDLSGNYYVKYQQGHIDVVTDGTYYWLRIMTGGDVGSGYMILAPKNPDIASQYPSLTITADYKLDQFSSTWQAPRIIGNVANTDTTTWFLNAANGDAVSDVHLQTASAPFSYWTNTGDYHSIALLGYQTYAYGYKIDHDTGRTSDARVNAPNPPVPGYSSTIQLAGDSSDGSYLEHAWYHYFRRIRIIGRAISQPELTIIVRPDTYKVRQDYTNQLFIRFLDNPDEDRILHFVNFQDKVVFDWITLTRGITNAQQWTTTPLGTNAPIFDGSTYVNLNFTDGFEYVWVSLWFKLPVDALALFSNRFTPLLVTHDIAANNKPLGGFGLYGYNGKLYIGWTTFNDDLYGFEFPEGYLGSWVHIIFTIDTATYGYGPAPNSDGVRMVINGVKYSYFSQVFGSPRSETVAPIHPVHILGAVLDSDNNVTEGYIGSIGQIRVYKNVSTNTTNITEILRIWKEADYLTSATS